MKLLRRWIYYGRSIFRILFNFTGWLPLIPPFLNPKIRQNKIVHLRKPSLQFTVRGAMDLWSIKETFLDAFYTRYGVPVRNRWQVMDIGAGIGDFSLYAVQGHPDTIVYAFEPYPESFRLLQTNIELNAADNVRVFKTAIWRQKGKIVLDSSVGEPLQMITKDVSMENDGGEFIPVDAIRLEEALDQCGIDTLDLLKLDCEGAEYDILMGSSLETLLRINRIIMEYHDLNNRQNHKVLASFLEGKGYQVSCYQNFVHDHIGYLFAKRG